MFVVGEVMLHISRAWDGRMLPVEHAVSVRAAVLPLISAILDKIAEDDDYPAMAELEQLAVTMLKVNFGLLG